MFKFTSMAKHKAHNTGWMPKKLENTISQSWTFGHNRQWADPSNQPLKRGCVFYNEPIYHCFIWVFDDRSAFGDGSACPSSNHLLRQQKLHCILNDIIQMLHVENYIVTNFSYQSNHSPSTITAHRVGNCDYELERLW